MDFAAKRDNVLSAVTPENYSSEGLLCVTATFLGVPVFRRRTTGKVRARIAPATICQRDRSAFLKRAILAVPILAIFDHGAPSCRIGRRRRQVEGQKTNCSSNGRNHAGHRHPPGLVLLKTTRLASFC